MQTIKNFIKNFLQAEATASDTFVKPNTNSAQEK